MSSVLLNTLDFEIAEGEMKKDLMTKQKRWRKKCFFKRMLLIIALIMVFVVFQLIARKTVPTRFAETETVERLFVGAFIAFGISNFLSYAELLLETKILFDIKSQPVIKLTVKKKMVTEELKFRRQKYRYLICEYKEQFVLDRIHVRGPFGFSNIKVGDEVYVERTDNSDGAERYYFVA
ncbi:MAG: hypothetical protein K6G85_06795 [Eubacterium sp.]|nr:hypothetical protein [Eubacterium sp.]